MTEKPSFKSTTHFYVYLGLTNAIIRGFSMELACMRCLFSIFFPHSIPFLRSHKSICMFWFWMRVRHTKTVFVLFSCTSIAKGFLFCISNTHRFYFPFLYMLCINVYVCSENERIYGSKIKVIVRWNEWWKYTQYKIEKGGNFKDKNSSEKRFINPKNLTDK